MRDFRAKPPYRTSWPCILVWSFRDFRPACGAKRWRNGMKLRDLFLASLSVTALTTMAAQPAHATTVATIVGAYDNHVYDTPELQFTNTSGGTLTNGQMVLRGYQGLNNGITQTAALPDFGAGTSFVDWGSIPGAPSGTTHGNL